jgi:hypothetical protein
MRLMLVACLAMDRARKTGQKNDLLPHIIVTAITHCVDRASLGLDRKDYDEDS